MLVVSPIIRAVTHPTSLYLLQLPIPLLTRFVSKFLRSPASDILHVNRVVITGGASQADSRRGLAGRREISSGRMIQRGGAVSSRWCPPVSFVNIAPGGWNVNKLVVDNHSAYMGHQIVAIGNVSTAVWMVK